jgi:V/A-type H+/Na+-transporting ATPase subunit C
MRVVENPIFGKPGKYGFAGPVLSIFEKEMISQGQVEQLKTAANIKELMRMLSDTVYAPYFEKDLGIDELVETEIIKIRESLYELIPEKDHWFFDTYYRRYDYNNLKMALKSYFMGKPVPVSELSEAGNLSPEELAGYINDEKFDDIPLEFDFESLEKEFKSSGELRVIDTVLDKAYYSEYKNAADKLGDEYFLDYLKEEIDLKNILIFIRTNKADLPMEHYLLSGGSIEKIDFCKYAGDSSVDALMSDSVFSDYRGIIRDGLGVIEKTGSFAEIETAIRNHLISLLKEGRDVMFTVKPFIGMLIAKEHEVQLLKKIFIHVSNNIEFGIERDLVYV